MALDSTLSRVHKDVTRTITDPDVLATIAGHKDTLVDQKEVKVAEPPKMK